MPSRHEALSLGQSAAYLALSQAEISTLVERGELDGQFDGSGLHIHRADLDEWVATSHGHGPDQRTS